MTSFATASTAERARFLWWYAAAPAAALGVLASAFELSSLDRRIAEWFVSDGGEWLGGGAWWANELLHLGGQWLVLAIGVAALVLGAASWWWRRVRALRRPAWFVAATLACGAGSVALLKDVTNVDCPRDLVLFGGDRPYVRLLEDKPNGLPRGRCWPGGHSSGAFSLFGLYLVARERDRSWSRAALASVLGLGSVFGFGQWSRGAHFVSHDVWSAGICWFVALGLYLFVFRGRLGPAAVRVEGSLDVASEAPTRPVAVGASRAARV
jgi:membrane-associated PAP2 superfamily phosphatase